MTDENIFFFCRNIIPTPEWANFSGKISLHVQNFWSLVYVDAFCETEGKYTLACLIFLPCVATLFATRALETPHNSSPFLSLSSGPLVTASNCCCMPCLAQWGCCCQGGCSGRATAAKSLLWHWLGASRLWWQSLSPGLASQRVSFRELAARDLLWALVQLLCHQLASTGPVCQMNWCQQ